MCEYKNLPSLGEMVGRNPAHVATDVRWESNVSWEAVFFTALLIQARPWIRTRQSAWGYFLKRLLEAFLSKSSAWISQFPQSFEFLPVLSTVIDIDDMPRVVHSPEDHSWQNCREEGWADSDFPGRETLKDSSWFSFEINYRKHRLTPFFK